MTEKRDVVRRLQAGQSIRSISEEAGIHRVTIRKIKAVATDRGWLVDGAQLPSESAVAEAFGNTGGEHQPHELDRIKHHIKRWLDGGDSYTVIHQLANEYVRCSEATVRRYIQRTFPKHPKVTVPRSHEPGTLEVDFGYAGLTYDWIERRNRKTWLFSGRLAFSRNAWRERVYRMDVYTFIQCHIHAFEFFGGVPQMVVPDNLKQAILKASFTEPIPNAIYQEFAIHYGFRINPCLPGMPEHKGGVESDIKYTKRNFWPVFVEHQRRKGREVPDGAEMAEALLVWGREVANRRIISGVGASPQTLFDEGERAALLPLPSQPWERVQISQAKVQSTWTIQFDKAFYSVPWQFIGKTVRVMANPTTVRIFHDHKEIAVHPRASRPWERIRNRLHEPPNATEYIAATRAGTIQRAAAIGAPVAEVCRQLFEQKGVDGLRPARAVVSLVKTYGSGRLRNACQRILAYDTVSYSSVHRCLKNKLDMEPIEARQPATPQDFAFARPVGFFGTGGAS